jgi:CRP-like cAMP-binding protein
MSPSASPGEGRRSGYRSAGTRGCIETVLSDGRPIGPLWHIVASSGVPESPVRTTPRVTNSPSDWTATLPALLAEVFPSSRPDSRQALAASASVRAFETDQPILRQGDETSFVLILGGHVAFRRTTVDGRQLITLIVTRGALAAFLPLASRPTSVDVLPVTPTRAAVWNSAAIRSLATTDPGLAIDILDHVLATFENIIDRLDTVQYQNALRRVARVLNLHTDLFFSEPAILTRTHLPSMVGTSREMTGRVLRALESRGLVARVGRSRLRLLDPAGLAHAAEAGDPTPAGR